MAVTKTYSLTVKYERDDVNRTYEKSGVTTTQAALSESDDAYVEIRKIILKRIADVVPVSQGVIEAQISGTVSES